MDSPLAAGRKGRPVALVVGLLLLVTTAGILGAFLRVIDCPDCKDKRIAQQMMEEFARRSKVPPPPKWKCDRCKGADRVSLFSKWFKPKRTGPDWLIDE
jgi:hypothetical protein